MPAIKEMVEGQKITFEGKKIEKGNILHLGNMLVKTQIYNIESRPGDGGVFVVRVPRSIIWDAIPLGGVDVIDYT